MIERTQSGAVHVLKMRNGENRLNLDFLAKMNEELDAVEKAADGPCALVLTGEGKFFSNGIDLDFLLNAAPNDQTIFASRMEAFFQRVLALPIPTVAALNGHAFAGGAILALTCDFRIQRQERGWICISEVDVGVPIAGSMMKLIRTKLSQPTAREAVLTGRRYSAREALAAGFVDATATDSDLLPQAVEMAGNLASKERQIFGLLKSALFEEVKSAPV